MKNLSLILMSLVSGNILSSCATMFSGTTQSVQLNTVTDGQPVFDSYCTVQNGRGSWSAMAPDTVVVRRDGNPLSVNCVSKDKLLMGTANIEPYYNSTNLWNIPLILFFYTGIVGFIVDGASGTTNEYPYALTIKMRAANNLPLSESKPQSQIESH